jgi:hypothetical protein
MPVSILLLALVVDRQRWLVQTGAVRVLHNEPPTLQADDDLNPLKFHRVLW